MGSSFDKFTERARRVLRFAQEEAHRLGHDYMGTEHLLLGLLRYGETAADGTGVVMDSGVSFVKLKDARAHLEKIVGRGEAPARGETGLSAQAKRVLESAVDEAKRLNHDQIEPEHLWLGLLRENEGAAIRVLMELGVDLASLRSIMLIAL